jgi:hypothetical protein
MITSWPYYNKWVGAANLNIPSPPPFAPHELLKRLSKVEYCSGLLSRYCVMSTTSYEQLQRGALSLAFERAVP